MTGQRTPIIGSTVKPASDGLDIRWTLLRGTVIGSWYFGVEHRVEVRWSQPWGKLYGTCVPASLLEVVR